MDQAPVLDCQFLDLFPCCQDCRAAPEVGVGGCQIADALVAALVVVVLDEGGDGDLKFALQIVVFQQDTVLESLMPTLDLALRLRVVGRTADVIHAMFTQICGKVTRDITGAVIAQKSWLVQHGDAVAA